MQVALTAYRPEVRPNRHAGRSPISIVEPSLVRVSGGTLTPAAPARTSFTSTQMTCPHSSVSDATFFHLSRLKRQLCGLDVVLASLLENRTPIQIQIREQQLENSSGGILDRFVFKHDPHILEP